VIKLLISREGRVQRGTDDPEDEHQISYGYGIGDRLETVTIDGMEAFHVNYEEGRVREVVIGQIASSVELQLHLAG